MVSRWPPTELFEGYNIETVRENYVITDGTRSRDPSGASTATAIALAYAGTDADARTRGGPAGRCRGRRHRGGISGAAPRR